MVSNHIRKRLPYFAAVAIILLGIGLSSMAFGLAWAWERERAKEDFKDASENRYTALQREIESDLQVVTSIQALYNASDRVERSEFHDFTDPFLSQHDSIQALEWIPRVPDSRREAFEMAAGQDGFPGFRITERDAQGHTLRAAQRDEYYPIYFVEPYRGNEVALGYDLASNTTRREALERARDTGEMVATGRITLVQETGNQYGFLVYAPIYRKGTLLDSVPARRDNLQGFALGVFRIGDLVEKSLTYLSPAGIDLYLYDPLAAEQDRFLYHHSSTGNPTIVASTGRATPAAGEFDYAKTLDVAGRQWQIVFRPTSEFIAARSTWAPWGVLAVGLVFTAFAGSFLLASIHRAARIEVLVHQLTAEMADRQRAEEALRQSEAQFRHLFENNPQPMWVYDLQTMRFLQVNEAAVARYGYSRDEFLQMDLTQIRPAEDVPRLVNDVRRERPTIQSSEGWQHRFKNGQVIDVRITSHVLEYLGRPAALVIAEDITERKRAEAEIETFARQQAVAAELGQFALAHTDLQWLMNQVVSQIAQTLDVEYCKILELLPGGEQLVLRAGVGWREGLVGHARVGARKDSQAGYTLLCNEPVIVEDLQTETRFSGPALLKDHGIVSGISVIVHGQGQPFGILGAHSTRRSPFTENDAHFLQAVANLLATAIRRKQIEEAGREQRVLVEALRDTAAALNSTLDFDAALDRILDNVSRVVPHDAADIMLLEGGLARIVRCRGYAERGQESGLLRLRAHIEDWPTLYRAVQAGLPALIPDTETEPTWVRLPETDWVRSYLGVPIRIKGGVVGFLNLDSATPGFFTANHALRLQAFADQAATALENARLLTETEQRAQQLALLYDAGLALNSTLEPRAQLEFLFKIAGKILRADGADFFGYNAAQRNLRLEFSVGHEEMARERLAACDFTIEEGSGAPGWVGKNRLPLNIADVSKHAGWPKLDPMLRSGVWVPVIHENELRGVLGVFSKEVGAFSPQAERLLVLFANQVAVAMENARLLEETRRRASHQTALNAIITAATTRGDADLNALLNIAVERMLEALRLEMGAIWLRRSAYGGLGSMVRGLPEEIGAAMLGVVRTQGIEFRDTSAVSDWQFEQHPFVPIMNRFGIRASITVLLQCEGRRIGGLSVAAPEPRRWADEEVAFVEAVGRQLGGAIERLQLFGETRQRLSELEAVNRISTAMRESESLERMLPILLDETLAVLECPAGSIWLYEPATDELRNVIGRGWLEQVHIPMKPGEGIGGTVFASGGAYISPEFASDPITRAAVRTQVPAGWGGAGIPIRTSQHVIGVLFVSVALPREITPNEARLLTIIAEIAGNAIQRTRLHEQTERHVQRLAALHEVDQAITASLDVHLALDAVLKQVTTQLQVDAAAILVLNPYTHFLEYAGGQGFRSKAITGTRLRLGEGIAGRAALERRMISVSNLPESRDLLAHSPFLFGEDFVAFFAVPLIAKGQVKGVLDLFHRAALAPNREWFEFLETLAEQAAIALDNAELFNGLQRSNAELVLAYDTTIEGWSRALDLRDKETEGHTRRVTEMTERLARAMGIPDVELVHVRRGALLHDIGKMGVPDSILLKPGPLTDPEWEVMRQHPRYAFELLAPVAYLRPALEIPYCHHEKWDGTGYPRGLKGEQIPRLARIFAVVDVWDALLSDRPYRAAWTREQVREHIRALAGTHFDPRVVEQFLRFEASPM